MNNNLEKESYDKNREEIMIQYAKNKKETTKRLNNLKI